MPQTRSQRRQEAAVRITAAICGHHDRRVVRRHVARAAEQQLAVLCFTDFPYITCLLFPAGTVPVVLALLADAAEGEAI